MSPSELARSYDDIAHVWQEPHIQTNGITQFERALSFTTQHRHALDIGCGSSGRFLDRLLQHGFQAEGLDVSERMIVLARQKHPCLTFHQADISAWEFPRSYDFISAWDSIWHLPLSAQEPVMRKICASLSPSGVFLFTTGGLDEATEKTDSSMGPPLHYSVLGIPRTLALLAQCGCICRHLEYDQLPEKHLYIIAQKS
jgi:2-polyprenyl-3-methyl-5-hydroxy-6-metoxy-1,4-benzoquinol methylase